MLSLVSQLCLGVLMVGFLTQFFGNSGYLAVLSQLFLPELICIAYVNVLVVLRKLYQLASEHYAIHVIKYTRLFCTTVCYYRAWN